MILIGLIASVSMPVCPPDWLDPIELERLLSIETSSSSVRAMTLEVIDCERDPHSFRITIEATNGALLARRRTSLADIAIGVRLRVLALVIGEMIGAPRIEPEPEPPPVLPPPPPIAPLPAPEPTRFWSATAAARYLVTPGSTTFGARLGAIARLDTPFPLAIWGGVGAEAAYGRGEPGSASLFAATAIVGMGLVSHRPGLQLAVGPAVEVGWATITGSTDKSLAFARSINDAIVVAELEGRVDVEIESDLWLEVTLGLGATLRGLIGTADSLDLIGVAGPAARLGIGIASGF